MAIDPDANPVFPNNVVAALGPVIEAIDSDCLALYRPLRPSDPNYSVGVYGTLWTPDDESMEIGHPLNPMETTLQRYQIGIQTLVKDGDPMRGLTISSILTNRVRAVVYRNQPIRVALTSLYVVDSDGHRESLKRWGIRTQRFMSNEIEGQFITISVLDLWIETEMS